MSRKVNKGKSLKLSGAKRTKKMDMRDPKAQVTGAGQMAQGKARSPSLVAKGRRRKSKTGGGTWGEVT